MGLLSKKENCIICGEESKDYFKLKDKTVVCRECDSKICGKMFPNWKNRRSEDAMAVRNMPKRDENFNANFVCDVLEADTESGLFVTNKDPHVYKINEIKKFYVRYNYASNDSDDSAMLLQNANFIIEMNNPSFEKLIFDIERDKSSIIEVLDVLDIAAKKSYKENNARLIDFLENVTGKKLSKDEKKKYW